MPMTYIDASGETVTGFKLALAALRGVVIGAVVILPIGWYLLAYQQERLVAFVAGALN